MNKLFFLFPFLMWILIFFLEREAIYIHVQEKPEILFFLFPVLLIFVLITFVHKNVNLYKHPNQKQLEDDYGVGKEPRNGNVYKVAYTTEDINLKSYGLPPVTLPSYRRNNLYFINQGLIVQYKNLNVDIQIPFNKIISCGIKDLRFGHKTLHIKIEKYLDIYIYSEQINDILREIKKYKLI